MQKTRLAKPGPSGPPGYFLNLVIESKILKEKRVVHLFCTDPALLGGDSKIPFIYLQDGQNLFDAVQKGRFKWGVDDTAARLRSENRIPDMLFIAVEHGVGRAQDYTPTFDKSQKSGGGVRKYLDFLIQELHPFVMKKTGLRPLEKKTAIGGSSLGGICSLMAWMLEPEFFNFFMVLSPSLWWDERLLLKRVDAHPARRGKTRLWLDMGVWEWRPDMVEKVKEILKKMGVAPEDVDENIPHPLRDTRELVDLLEKKGLMIPEDFFYYEDPSGSHDEGTWRKRFFDIILYFYGHPVMGPLDTDNPWEKGN